ncbi:MAG: monothiol glutaredoxin [Rickettsiales bacterium]|jgi:monothiol glutaredoxin
MTDTNQKIQKLISENNVVLFMKGTKDFPNCGFSSAVCNIFNNKIKIDFLDINVLEDPELRESIKKFSDWPTIPQLYIKGEFIGGCDIIREMFSSGELEKLLKDKDILQNA